MTPSRSPKAARDLGARALLPLAGALSLAPFTPSWAALLAGALISLVFGNPWLAPVKRWTAPLLQLSVVGLGAAMDLGAVLRVGASGMGYTLIGIGFALALGTALGRWLGVGHDTSLLISSGTAICGGSAIAAVSGAIGARAAETAVALAAVFLLNAAALVIFPPLGHALGLGQREFGLWAALAIHDTSSVVGASLQYGNEALQVATTVKLARALWIAPLALALAAWVARRRGATRSKIKVPWFIAGFLAAAALVTWVPALQEAGAAVAAAARRALVLTLFLIGTQLTRETLRAVGARPFVQAVLLWLAVGGGTLAAILGGWIR